MLSHQPVMMERVMTGLDVREGGTYWDGTFGGGGHGARILELLKGKGRLVASDRDEIGMAASAKFEGRPDFRFIRGTLAEVVDQVPESLAGFLWDLGCSTMQLKNGDRGFSFRENGPLDMRMDARQELTAFQIVNQYEENKLADLIYQYGEERFSRGIAARVVSERRRKAIEDTRALADICRGVYPRRYHRIDPATRTFQALRIAVNDELGQLERTLPKALARLEWGGRGVIISFHSLEDRIVKHRFREHAKAGDYRLVTKKPMVAGEDERRANPASRSAKLRIIARERSPQHKVEPNE